MAEDGFLPDFAQAGIRGKIDMAFKQHRQLPVQRWQNSQRNAYHGKCHNRYFRPGNVKGGYAHAHRAAQEDAEHVSPKADAKHMDRTRGIVQHFAEDTPPK
ncbi:hypothetical protein SDC9_170616 [bioreactor metagenome]|uniref:Uncharacterized protein n=1 Tax=bioreactor metagenome TaxID=1076179 RepID=A0A645G8K8_9ZZZZ